MKTGLSGGIARLFLDSKLTPLLIAGSFVAGAGAILTTPREEEPQIQVPMIDIAVGLPGAVPSEVEKRIAEPIERAVWEIKDLKYVYSTSFRDGAMVTARFKVGTDPDIALSRVWGKLLANADRLPPGATRPLVKLHGISEVPVIALTLSGADGSDNGFQLRREALELMRRLKQIPDVAETWVIGGARREVRINILPEKLAAAGLSINAVVQALENSNADLPAGNLVSNNRTIPVRAGSLLRTLSDLEDVTIGVYQGRPVRLTDVAEIEDGPGEPDDYVTYWERSPDSIVSRSAVTIAIAKREGTSAARIARDVERTAERLRGSIISTDTHISVTRNYGETATEKTRELLLHILIATAGVSLLVLLALGYREALVVLVAVPVTLALTLLVYRLLGYTLNRITLFALVFAIGILVDDAIVIVENIARHIALGDNAPGKAAVLAVDEVGNPTILATLAVIAAILPMAFVTGLMGPYMRPIPVGASVAMLFSLAVAFIATPYLTVRLITRRDTTHASAAGAGAAVSRFTAAYERMMSYFIEHSGRRRILYGSMVAALLLAVAFVPLKLVVIKMLPFDNKSEFQLIVDTPEGTALEQTQIVAQALALRLAQDPDVANIQTYVGTAAPFNFNGLVRHYFLRRGPAVADLQVNLVPRGERESQSHDIALRLRPAIDSIARAFNATVKVAEIPPGPPVQAPLTAEVYAPIQRERERIASAVRDVLERTPGIVDVDWSLSASHDGLRVTVDYPLAASGGTNTQTIARTVAASIGGAQAGFLHDSNSVELTRIMVSLPRRMRSDTGDLVGISIPGLSGNAPLSAYVSLHRDPEPSPIFHKNLKPVVYVTADVAGAITSPVYGMLAVQDSIALTGAAVSWTGPVSSEAAGSIVWDGEWQITREVFRDLGVAFAAVLVLIYLLVVAWFQSFRTPLIIMAPIPLTLIGIIPAHAAGGAFFTATSMIGMIALAGIIVRNSILLVDFIELSLERGNTLARAVVESGVIRSRPIILTALAVVIGGIVMVADPIFQGLGVALISGALASTALTLVTIPLLYLEVNQ